MRKVDDYREIALIAAIRCLAAAIHMPSTALDRAYDVADEIASTDDARCAARRILRDGIRFSPPVSVEIPPAHELAKIGQDATP